VLAGPGSHGGHRKPSMLQCFYQVSKLLANIWAARKGERAEDFAMNFEETVPRVALVAFKLFQHAA
jgi:hypothetical protein